jgi:hypothetical protein
VLVSTALAAATGCQGRLPHGMTGHASHRLRYYRLISPALRFSATYEYLVICLVFIGPILFVCLEREYS